MAAGVFDLYGPLPSGTTVLEASAGTGKTYTIAALATRYVAEGVADLSQLMLVTFGRAATQELRDRTRRQLTETARGLADPLCTDDLVLHLAALDREGCRRRLMRALSDFDAATITTTHSFCQRMLDGLGIAGEREPGATLAENVDDLVGEVVDDLYLQAFAGQPESPPKLTQKEARAAALSAVHDRDAVLEPADAAPDTAAGQRVAIARAARREVARRKRQHGIRDFDDLLHLLRDVLADPVHGEAACARIRSQFRVVLVDEFQDTDPVQWDILRRAFHGHSSLILIGDPKQAIYAFRGAEVLSYLDAVRLADVQQTLATNYRSDAALLSALEQVYGGAELGDPRIVVHPVVASHSEARLPGQVPFRLRVLAREPPLVRGGYAGLPEVRRRVAADLADDVVRLLDSRTAYDGLPVAPGDIAVLVRKNSQTALVREALEHAGVPSVLAGSTSVFATPSATDWLRVLQAIEQPHRAGRVRLAALTPLVGWTATSLAQAPDDDVARLGAQLRDWAALFEVAGLAAVFERLATSCRLESRLLAVVSGERRLTDIRHLAQALNRAAVEDGLGISALTAWLADRVAEPAAASTADRSRRLESDAAAVQIVTVHASKGLEFPIVYLPYGWDGARWSQPDSLLLHDAENRRVRDLGGKGSPGWEARKRVHDAEEAGDDLRLLYVALTRAKSQVVAWWAPSTVTSSSALHRLLLGRNGGQVAASARTPPDDTALSALRAWAGSAGGCVGVEPVGPARLARWAAPPVPLDGLAVARSTRALDQSWRRTSYSALTAAAHEAGPGVGSEAEHPEKTDEPETTLIDVAASGPPSTMNAFAGGAAFGTLVHEILEHVEDPAELLVRCREAVAARLAAVDPAALAEALLPVMHTPLGIGTLASIPVTDRLAELDFEVPLAGGDVAAGDDVTLKQIAALLREHLGPGDVLAPYADLLETVEAPPLRGYLSGSIDVVLRVAGPRYVVVDYKTNRLARGELTALHYTRAAMAAEMMRAHYPLQALLYCVALHRYLRWRQPGYDPRTHLGGVQYLFVRGMVGAATPPGCGVFDWQPSAELVVELSDLLAGG